MCEEVGIKFIGPSAKVMDLMGDKINARKQMIKAGVPVIPGSDGEVYTAGRSPRDCRTYWLPCDVGKHLQEAVVKGIRKVEKTRRFGCCFESASSEAQAAFGMVPCMANG